MYHQSSKQKEITVRIITYSLMTLAVLVLVAFLVMTMLGYRFNQDDGSLVQGGLVQFSSQPSGADVFINGRDIDSNTATKATLEPGDHDILLKRKGYRDWTKEVDVRAGKVTWINYARLIPEELKPTQIREFEQLDSTLASPDSRWYALLPDASKPELLMANIDREKPEFKEFNLQEGTFTAPSEDESSQFKLSQWSGNGRYLLIEHRYGDNREWIVADREDSSKTRNMTTQLSINPTAVEFMDNSGRLFYVLEDSNVRRINLGESTISRPLITDVKSFDLVKDRDRIMTYESLSKDGVREVGYLKDSGKDSDKPVVLRSVNASEDTPLRVAIDEYYDENYVALAIGDRVEVMKGKLPEADSAASLKLIETIELAGEVRQLAIKGGGRFIYAISGNAYTTYDLEQDAQYTTTLATQEASPKLRWLDEYIVWSDFGGDLQIYDFDGANNQKIAPVAPGYDVTLARGGKYVYSIASIEDGGFALQQVRLIL